MCKAFWISGLVIAGAVCAGIGFTVGKGVNPFSHQQHAHLVHQHRLNTGPAYRAPNPFPGKHQARYQQNSETITEHAIPKTANVIVTPYEHTRHLTLQDGGTQTITTGEKDGIQYKIVQTEYKGNRPSKTVQTQLRQIDAENARIEQEMNHVIHQMNQQFGQMHNLQIQLEPGPVIQH